MTIETVLPEAIQRQVAEAEALERELYGEPTPVPGNTEPPAESPVPVDPPVAPVEPPAPPQPSAEDEYRKKYEVLQGKYNAEVPRLHEQLREATAQIQQALAELNALKSAPPPQPPAPPQPDNDAEVFGEDIVEAIDRRAEQRARKLVEAELAKVNSYVKSLEDRLSGVSTQVTLTAQDRFLKTLGENVPDYEQLNTDPGFLGWLGEVDPVYGLPRQEALNAAAKNLDAARVSTIFLAYKQLTGKQVEQAAAQSTRQELERQVAPPTARTAPPQAPAGRVWTAAEYQAALDPRNIAKLGREAADRLFSEAEQALAEGRVRF